MKKYLLLFIVVGLFYGCNKEMYSYYNYDDATYFYSKSSETKDYKKLLKSYQKIVEKPKGKTKKVPPGACVDYGYLLLLKGDTVQAKNYFDKETVIYPESKTYVQHLKTKLGL
jgi:hypothetical protein